METVLLVNGLWRNRDSMKSIGKALSKEGYSTLFFDFKISADIIIRTIKRDKMIISINLII